MAGGTTTNSGNAANYTSSYGQGTIAFNQLYDAGLVLSDPVLGVAYATGGWRGITPADFIDITLTGVSMSIGSVAITGSPNVTVNGGFLGITGAPVITITGNPTIYTTPVPIAPMAAVAVSGTNTFASVTGIALLANAVRRKAYIQNISSGSVLWVGYGYGPSTGVANVLLKGASNDNLGDGGSLIEDQFTGSIYVSGTTRFIAWQA